MLFTVLKLSQKNDGISKKLSTWLVSTRSTVGSCIAVILIGRAFSKKSKMLLLELNASIVNSLRLAEKICSSGRAKKRSLSPTSIVGRKAAVLKPMPDIRYDSLDHFPEFNGKRNRCSLCPDAIAMYLVQSVKLCPAFEKRKIVF